MGAACSDQQICARLALREQPLQYHSGSGLPGREEAFPSESEKAAAARARIDKREQEEERLVITAALEAVRSHRFSRGNRKASVGPRPEVSGLGDRVTLAATGAPNPAEGPFDEKVMAMRGLTCLETLVDVHLVGVRCQCGRMAAFPRPNQDDYFFVQTSDSYRISGVFDGHGVNGHEASAMARDVILRELLAKMPSRRPSSRSKYQGQLQNLFVQAFQKAHEAISTADGLDATLSGTTATVAVHDIKRNWLTVAWTGNSRCLLGEVQEVEIDLNEEFGDADFVKRKNIKIKRKLLLVPACSDHTVERHDERSRVLGSGAYLRPVRNAAHEICAPGEQWPGIPVTRCLGSLMAHHYGVIHVPEVFDCDLAQDKHEPAFVVMATDGVWGTVKEGDVLAMLRESFEENLTYGIGQVLEKAQRGWEQKEHKVVDDITMLVMRL